MRSFAPASTRRWATLAGLAGALLGGCSDPKLGDLPATCSAAAPECPEGLSCIHGVCAAQGTAIPTTVARLSNFRAMDLHVVAQPSSALVTWQTYAYSDEGEGFVGARVDSNGDVSPVMQLVGRFEADPGALEPYYDVLPVSGSRLLVTIAASPLPGDASADPRLITYRVDLPAEGRESEAPVYASAWQSELRMPTVGYGAVSRPKLVHGSGGVELGYVQTLVKTEASVSETVGELVVYSLGLDGSLPASPPLTLPARAGGLPIAVGVVDAIPSSEGVWWVLDDARPSVIRANTSEATEARLARLAIPLTSDGASLVYLAPSKRVGDDALPTDPVSGPSKLMRADLDAGTGDESLGELPTLRDTPRPVFLARAGKPALLVTAGPALDAGSITVYSLDLAKGTATQALAIDRFATSDVGGLGAVIVDGKLYVAWVDTTSDTNTIRMAVVPEP